MMEEESFIYHNAHTVQQSNSSNE